MTQDPRFRAVTHGRIVNGVLITDPVDVRFYKVTNSLFVERHLQDARVRMTLAPPESAKKRRSTRRYFPC